MNNKSTVNTEGYDIVWYDKKEIEQFKDDDRFREVFAFSKAAPANPRLFGLVLI